MKKFLKIIGIVVVLIVLFLALAPFLFKGTIEDLIKKNLNDNLNATVAWESLDLSLFKSFPDAAVVVKNFSVINNEPFKGDTLASGQRLTIDMGITQLFKSGDEAIKVDALQLDEGLINIKVDSLGNANYDIGKKDPSEGTQKTDSTATGFAFDLTHYEINDTRLNYLDEAAQTFLVIENLNHEGNGDFSLDTSTLKTQTNATVSFQSGDVAYLKENTLALMADFELDLKNQKYTFLDNAAKINELPLTFNGFVQTGENETDLDLTFTTPSSDFRNFLAVIPKVYVKNLDGVATTGDFSVDGKIKGKVTETQIPTLDISVKSSNASFKYPDLPKAVQNISIDAQLKNETGLVEDTYLNIGGLTFKIDDEIFRANGSIRNITRNALVNMTLNGTLNLAHIEQVLPIELEQDLSGVFKANVTTQFDMNSLETEQYQNIRTTGTANLKDFTYQDPAFKDTIEITEADVKMSPGTITLNRLEANSGQTDITATGNIHNLIPWIMAKQDLKGRFQVNSNTFNVNDFMSEETEKEAAARAAGKQVPAGEEAIKIPDFLDATMDFTAKRVIYDNVTLENAKGTVSISDEKAVLRNVTSQVFGGDVAFSGEVNTKETTPTFNMNLDLQKVDIDESFGQLALLKYIAPVAQALDGDLNTTLNLNGQLNNDLTPDLKTLAGNALAQVLTAEVSAERTPLLSKLGEQVTFLNLDKLSLQNVSTALDFNNGKIVVKPFTFKVEDIEITTTGSHGLDKSMDYQLNMKVPAKYLGSEVTKLLSKLDPKEANAMSVDLPVGVSGSMLQPTVNVNTQGAINMLTQKLIEKQKQDLKDKGVNILEDLIGGKNNSKNTNDPKNKNTGKGTQEQTSKVVNDILGGLFGNKKKKKDSTDNKGSNE